MTRCTIANGGVMALAELPAVPWADFSAALIAGVAAGGRLAALFARPTAGDGEHELFGLLAHDRAGTIELLRTQVADDFPSLTPQLPAAHLFEREMAEQYGLRPQGHPWFKPVRFHQPWRGQDAWGRAPGVHPQIGAMEYYRIDGDEVHEVAVGPVHAGVIEPGHFRFQCHGEEVLHLEISLGYQHRDIERTLAGGPHPITPLRMETLAGDTTIGHMTAYCQILETLGGVTISPRAAALRAVMLELERLANHVGDIGALAGDVGFLPTASFCGRLRGDYLNLSARICGSRFGRGMVRPGGVAFDSDAAHSGDLLERLGRVARDTDGALDLFFDAPSVLARLEGVGKVRREDAEAIGLVGVAARGCGLERDCRRSHPTPFWQGEIVAPTVEESGDVFARAAVRRRDIRHSHDLLQQTLRELPAGPLSRPLPRLQPEALTVSLIEGWRGEIVHVALTDADGRFSRYKVVDPSFRNWSGLALALRHEQISDFPLCNKSFNLSYCGYDL